MDSITGKICWSAAHRFSARSFRFINSFHRAVCCHPPWLTDASIVIFISNRESKPCFVEIPDLFGSCATLIIYHVNLERTPCAFVYPEPNPCTRRGPKLFRNSRGATCVSEHRGAASLTTARAGSATFVGIEPTPSDRWCSQMNEVDRSFAAGTTEPEFPRVDLNRWPTLSMPARRRADYLPICKGSVDFDRVSSPRLRREHLSCDAAPCAGAFVANGRRHCSRLRSSEQQAGYARPPT